MTGSRRVASRTGVLRRYYGSGPVQLVAVLASFALAGVAVGELFQDRGHRLGYLLWFLGAVVAHDLVLFPLYAVADRLELSVLRRRGAPGTVNYLRVPALLSGLLLIVFAPVIFRQSQPAYRAASGLNQDPYLLRWVLICVVLFAASGLLYLVRARTSRST